MFVHVVERYERGEDVLLDAEWLTEQTLDVVCKESDDDGGVMVFNITMMIVMIRVMFAMIRVMIT